MKKYLIILLAPFLMAHSPSTRPVIIEDTGISGSNLSTTPESNAIDLLKWKRNQSNTITWKMAITAGSTTRVQVRCYETDNADGTHKSSIEFCDGAQPTSNCGPDKREFTLSNYTAEGGVIYIRTRYTFRDQIGRAHV